MKCQNLLSGKNKKNILICCLRKDLPRVLSVKKSCKYFQVDAVSLRRVSLSKIKHLRTYNAACYSFIYMTLA